MKRLPDNFSCVLESIDKILDFGSNTDYSTINKLYKKVDKILKSNECLIPDVDKMLNEYKLNNTTVTKMRRLCKKRNKGIYSMCKRSSKLKRLIKSLYKEFLPKLGSKLKPEHIESVLKKLIRKRSDGWCGCWTVVQVDDSSGRIKDINLFDIDDKKYITRELKKILQKS